MIKKYLKGVDKDFLKVTFWSGIGTLLKTVFSFVNIKFVSVILGPSGAAIIGNLTSVINSFMIIAGAGINTGTVKYTIEYQHKNFKLQRILTGGTKITLLFSFLSALVLIVFSYYFAKSILYSGEYFYIFIILGISIFIFSVTNHFLSIINGKKKYSSLIWINNLISIFSILYSIVLILLYKLTGALIAAVSYQLLVGIIITVYLFKNKLILRHEIAFKSNWNDYKKLLSFSLVGIISAILVPLSQLTLREFLISSVSIDAAGYWESLNRLSAMYLATITGTLSIYYLPKLAEIAYGKDSVKFVSKVFLLVVPLLCLVTLFVFFLRERIVLLFFDYRFWVLKDVIVLQFIGDLIKIASWLFAYQLIAKSKVKLVILTEILFYAMYIGSSYLLIQSYGLYGSILAYVLNYLLYFISMVYLFYIFNRKL